VTFLPSITPVKRKLPVIIQGKEILIHKSYAAVNAFQMKLLLFPKQIKEKKFAHFCTLQTMLVNTTEVDSNILCKLHKVSVTDLNISGK
jgi:hypothetical protein